VIAARRLRVVVCLTVAIAAGGGTVAFSAASGTAVDPPSQHAVRRRPNAPTLVIGDSALAALSWAPEARHALIAHGVTLDLRACRRLYQPSCASPAPTTAYEALGVHGEGYQTALIAVGYNDVASITAEGFEAVVHRARQLGYTRVVWMTLRNHSSFTDRNQVVRDLLGSGRFPDVMLADWGSYSEGRSDWFVSDGVHFRVIGAWAAADYLTRRLAFLDGRICPVPSLPDGPIPDPCPDPDLTGPSADLRGLYPIVGG
jgi:hypothetical protein